MDVRTPSKSNPSALSGLSALHFDQESTDALAERHFMAGSGE
jgi:hypothetical protein